MCVQVFNLEHEIAAGLTFPIYKMGAAVPTAWGSQKNSVKNIYSQTQQVTSGMIPTGHIWYDPTDVKCPE